jgi:RimJ/RimL family protein N-acetyltransferase
VSAGVLPVAAWKNGAMTTLETDRLRLRQWRDEDLDALALMYADPEVMRYIRDGSTLDRTATAQHLGRMRRHWEEHGYGLFAVEVKDSGAMIGWAGLAVPLFLPEVLPAVEIGWRLARSAWGHGYATEAAAVALRFGFEEAGLDRIISIRHPENARSARVMDKLGLTFDHETVIPGFDQRVAVHAIDRATFLAGPLT